MAQRTNLIEHLRSNQPATFSLLKLAAAQGLASINRDDTALEIDNDLRLRHSKLHFLLDRLITEREDEASLSRNPHHEH